MSLRARRTAERNKSVACLCVSQAKKGGRKAGKRRDLPLVLVQREAVLHKEETVVPAAVTVEDFRPFRVAVAARRIKPKHPVVVYVEIVLCLDVRMVQAVRKRDQRGPREPAAEGP